MEVEQSDFVGQKCLCQCVGLDCSNTKHRFLSKTGLFPGVTAHPGAEAAPGQTQTTARTGAFSLGPLDPLYMRGFSELFPQVIYSLHEDNPACLTPFSVSACQTLPFSLCVVQHSISLGYPPLGSNKCTSWCKMGNILLSATLHDLKLILSLCH